jgi:hypothetical protein
MTEIEWLNFGLDLLRTKTPTYVCKFDININISLVFISMVYVILFVFSWDESLWTVV